MPFRDSKMGDNTLMKVKWGLEESADQDLLMFQFNDVIWSFPMDMVARFFLHEYENLERIVIYQMYDADDVVIEAGAGSGITGLCILRTGAKLTAFEPQEEYMNHAASLYATNGFEDVDVLGAALAGQTGTVKLVTDKIPWDATIMTASDAEVGIYVPCMGVNEAIDKFGANALHLDVEGAELEIMKVLDFSKINKFSLEVHPSMIGLSSYSDIIEPKLIDAGFEMVAEAGKERNAPTHNWVEGWKRKDN